MEFQGSWRTPSKQLQTSQEPQPQRKRARTPLVSPSIPTRESTFDTRGPSTFETVGLSTAQELIQKPTYVSWTETAQSQLFQWLEEPRNYDKWKCAGVKTSSGSTRTSGLTKKAITLIISRHLNNLQTNKTPEQVMSKMRYIEKKFKEAEDYLRGTGEGLNTIDEKMGIIVIRDKVLSLCPFYYQAKTIMSESVAVNPPYTGETGTAENFEEMLFGTSDGRGFYDSTAEEGNDLELGESSSSDDDEPVSEAELSAQQQSVNPQPPSEDAVQSRSAATRKTQPKKKKPKSFQESMQNIQEQNRVLMEKKLEMRMHHQDQRMLFLREEAQQKFNLENRRLDLEFTRMDRERDERREEREQQGHERDLEREDRDRKEEREQQRQEARIRELTLRVDLAKANQGEH